MEIQAISVASGSRIEPRTELAPGRRPDEISAA